MSKQDQQPRYVPLDDVIVNFESEAFFIIKELPIGPIGGVIFSDFEYNQLIGIDQNTGRIVRVNNKNVLVN